MLPETDTTRGPDDPGPAPAPAAFDARPAGADGRAAALTVLTPLPRFWSGPLRLLLWVKSVLGPDRQLQELSFIHVAHWAVIRRFPGAPRRSRYAHLLFMSNFNGSWRDYIDAFSLAVPGKMKLIWGTGFGFPGPVPPRPFAAYIDRNDLLPDHYWAAYPQATATEVASAVRLRADFERTFAAAPAGDAELAAAWREFLTRGQRDL